MTSCWQRKPFGTVPAPGAVPLQISSALLALDQVTFTADDPQFVLVGRGQVDGPRGNGGAKVSRVWNVQMCIRVGSETISTEKMVSDGRRRLPSSIGVEEDLPQRWMSQYFNNIQGVEVGHKQVRLPIGWNSRNPASWINSNYQKGKKLFFWLTKWKR